MAINDDVLLEAIRKRMLRQLEKEDQAAAITNNVYGGGGVSGPTGGLMSQMGNSAESIDPSAFDYFVDIDREDRRDEKGKLAGWKKKVHRYRSPKGEDPKGPKA